MAHLCNLCRKEFPKDHAYVHIMSHGGFSPKGTWVCWGCLVKIIEQCKDGTKGIKIQSGATREVEIEDIK